MSSSTEMSAVEPTGDPAVRTGPSGPGRDRSGPRLAAVSPVPEPAGHPAAPRDEGVDPQTFRTALGRHAAAVAVVTVAGEAGPVGVTVTSFSSVSLSPPLVSFYLAEDSTSWPAVRQAEHFAVNLLAAGQEELAARFARRGADRFAHPTRWRTGPADLPLLDGATTRLVCRRRWVAPVGDHFLVIGTVLRTEVGAADSPLLYAYGRFGRLSAG